MPTKRVKIVRDGSMCFVPVTFGPKAAFGKIKAPVKVTLNGFTYRTTIMSMGGVLAVPLRRSNREAAGLAGDETLAVTFELDREPRKVAAPDDLLRALHAVSGGLEGWRKLSYTHQREHVEAI